MDDSFADDDTETSYVHDDDDRHDTEIGNVSVAVRIRPQNEDERTSAVAGGPSCVDVEEKHIVVNTGKRGAEPYAFSFDHVFSPGTSQEEVIVCREEAKGCKWVHQFRHIWCSVD